MRAWLATLALSTTLVAAQEFTPARLTGGGAPEAPPRSIGWGWVGADVTVAASGRVTSYGPLFGTSPYVDLFSKAVLAWSFEPAREGEQPVESHVLVVACYRAPTLKAGPGSRPPTVGAAPGVPTPVVMVPPLYPPRVRGDGIVIVELRVDAKGAVVGSRIVRSGAGFDGAALDAATRWTFRPATREGAEVPSYVYLVFAFREPIVVQ